VYSLTELDIHAQFKFSFLKVICNMYVHKFFNYFFLLNVFIIAEQISG